MRKNKLLIFLFIGAIAFAGTNPSQRISISQYKNTQVYNLSSKTSLYLKELLSYNKVVVIVAHSVKCPFSMTSEPKVAALKTKFEEDSVSFIYLNSNPFESKINNTIDPVVQSAQKSACPYILDQNHFLQSLFNIKKNGTMLVIKQIKGEGIDIFYEGPIDDSPQSSNTKHDFLEMAIKNALENKASNFNTVETGCRILNH